MEKKSGNDDHYDEANITHNNEENQVILGAFLEDYQTLLTNEEEETTGEEKLMFYGINLLDLNIDDLIL